MLNHDAEAPGAVRGTSRAVRLRFRTQAIRRPAMLRVWGHVMSAVRAGESKAGERFWDAEGRPAVGELDVE